MKEIKEKKELKRSLNITLESSKNLLNARNYIYKQ